MAEKADRLTRVNELIKRELADYLERFSPAPAANMLVSVTGVTSSVDLRSAGVSVSIFGGTPADRAEVFRALNARRSDMQKMLARNLKFKHTPVLSFKPDRRIELGDRVLAMLNDPPEGDDHHAGE